MLPRESPPALPDPSELQAASPRAITVAAATAIIFFIDIVLSLSNVSATRLAGGTMRGPAGAQR